MIFYRDTWFTILFAVPAVDIIADTLTVDPFELGQLVTFELSVDLELTNGKTLPSSKWPHFDFKLYLSTNQDLDPMEDFDIGYHVTKSQWKTLTEAYFSNSNMDLSDPGTFCHLPIIMDV